MKPHRKDKQINFNKGNYLLIFNNVYESFEKDTLSLINQSYLNNLGKNETFIFQADATAEIDHIKSGQIYLTNGQNNQFASDCNIRVCTKEKYESLLKKYPPKYKIGDKVQNPYKRYKDKQLKAREEMLSVNEQITIIMRQKGLRHAAKQIPYLSVNKVETKVLYNIKYDKMLNAVVHNYHFDESTSDNKVSIVGYIQETAVVPYKGINEYWAELNE